MRHIRSITKADLSWFETSPLSIISGLVSLVQEIVPVITAIIDAKQETTT